jgi:anaerobic magnesium-protoporphyrin IX monomethyl ester cyclase
VSPPVVVAHSFFQQFDAKQTQKMRPYPPLATLYVAAGLRAAGHGVAVFDAMLASGEHEFDDLLAETKPRIVVLYEDNFNFLTKMCLTRVREAAFAMARAAHAHGAVVIAAGSDITDHADIYLAEGVDYAVLGEGDHTVAELADWLGSNASDGRGRPDHIAGVAMHDTSGATLHTPARRNERHPDVFAAPARDLIDIDRYRDAWIAHHGYFSMNMVSTRGCPFHCNWCAKPIWGQRYAMRSPGDVAVEMASIKHKYEPDHIWFADDIFGLRPDWVAEFADLVEKHHALIPFTMQSRCDLMTPAAVDGLARAGCREVWMGAESGSQRILDAMDKGTKVEEIAAARHALGAAGIRASFFIQFGYPGETWDDISATISMVRELLPDDIGVSVSYPLPGTRFHSMVVDDLETETNWHESNDLQMLFRGTYTTTFYRQLHLALHDDLNLRRRQAGLAAIHHPSLPEMTVPEQAARVSQAWESLDELERTCRNPRPTLLVRSGAPIAAPDLSESFN